MNPAPGYWMYETDGELVPAIQRYLEGEALTLREIVLIGAYLRRWINSPVWDTNPFLDGFDGRIQLARLRELSRVLTNRRAIEAWIMLATDFGVDPL
jgi:hypothetical protein